MLSNQCLFWSVSVALVRVCRRSFSGFMAAAPSDSLSASTWITETITGSHDFKITRYSLNKGIGCGKYIASEEFPVGGYSWKIRFYLDGKGENNYQYSSWVSVYLALESNAMNARAVFEVTLFDQSRNQPSHIVQKSWPHTFANQSEELGWKEFVQKHNLEWQSRYLSDDCLHLCGRVSVLRSHHGYKIQLPPSNIVQHLGCILKTGAGADVKFAVDVEKFSAHKSVLAARSSVFHAQFFGHLKNQSDQCIKIEGMKAPVFKALLHFIYWDDLPDPNELTGVESEQASTILYQDLLAAADRYDLDRLMLLCAAELCNNITVDNVLTTLTLAIWHNCLPLKSVCLKFVALPKNLKVVTRTEDFKYLKECCPNTYMQILEYAAGINNTTTISR